MCLILLSSALVGQTVQVEPALGTYFAHLFQLIGDPSQTTAELLIREEATASRFGLNSPESAALHVAAQQYRSFMAGINASLKQIAAPQPTLSSFDKSSAISHLNAERTQLVGQLASALLLQLRPEIIARFTFISKGMPQ